MIDNNVTVSVNYVAVSDITHNILYNPRRKYGLEKVYD